MISRAGAAATNSSNDGAVDLHDISALPLALSQDAAATALRQRSPTGLSRDRAMQRSVVSTTAINYRRLSARANRSSRGQAGHK